LAGEDKKKTQYGALEVHEIKTFELQPMHHTVIIDYPGGGAPATTIDDHSASLRDSVLGDPNSKAAQLLSNASLRDKEEVGALFAAFESILPPVAPMVSKGWGS
jgi:hypothetical protein